MSVTIHEINSTYEPCEDEIQRPTP